MFIDEFNLEATCQQLTLEVSKWKAEATVNSERFRFVQHRANQIEADLRDAEVLLDGHRKFEATMVEHFLQFLRCLDEAKAGGDKEAAGASLNTMFEIVQQRLKELETY